jgi:hypothetical protein
MTSPEADVASDNSNIVRSSTARSKLETATPIKQTPFSVGWVEWTRSMLAARGTAFQPPTPGCVRLRVMIWKSAYLIFKVDL